MTSDQRAVIGDQVRILRGIYCNHTALVERETGMSVKVAFAGGIRWYARSEVEVCRR